MNVSLLLVYLVEGQSTCVVLHILTTHLLRGAIGVCEVSGTGVWVEFPNGKQQSQARRRSAVESERKAPARAYMGRCFRKEASEA